MDNPNVLMIGLQAIHLLFAIYWFGSLIYTEVVLWPQMRTAGILDKVQTPLRTPQLRRLYAIPIIGTVVTGYLRGVAGGVFDRIHETYGLFFIVAAMVGVSMIVWWSSFPPRTMKNAWRAFYSAFWVMFVLMLGLRFTA